MAASSSPRRSPRKTAPGSCWRSAAAAGPAPTMTSRTPSSAVIPASRSTRFSVARRPTYPAISSPPGASSARICGLRLAGWKRWVSTPRPHSQMFSMPWPSRPVAVTVDGASVRTAPLWMPRSHRQANASPARPNR